jgi:hypothetical protein
MESDKERMAANTRPETICADTWKLACWRVQLAPANIMVCRGAGVAIASSEGTVLEGDISHMLAEKHTVLVVHISHCQRKWNH